MTKLPVNQENMSTESVTVDRISQRIKAIRTKKGISQKDFAEQLGIERSQYHRMENRGRKMTYETLELIAQKLDVSLISLVSDEINLTPGGDELAKLHQLVRDMEARIRDKEIITDLYERAKSRLTRYFLNRLFVTANELGFIDRAHTDTYEEVDTEFGLVRFTSNWGVAVPDEQGGSVLRYGNNTLNLMQVRDIYEHIEQEDSAFFAVIDYLFASGMIAIDGGIIEAYHNYKDSLTFRYLR